MPNVIRSNETKNQTGHPPTAHVPSQKKADTLDIDKTEILSIIITKYIIGVIVQ